MMNVEQAIEALRGMVKVWDADEQDSGVQLIAKIYGLPARTVLEILKGEWK